MALLAGVLSERHTYKGIDRPWEFDFPKWKVYAYPPTMHRIAVAALLSSENTKYSKNIDNASFQSQ